MNLIPSEVFSKIVNAEVAKRLATASPGPFDYPFLSKSEPNKRVDLITGGPSVSLSSKARLMRMATLRSVDSYFHRFRSNVRFASRPEVANGSHGRAWGRHHLYHQATLAKIVEIYRFYYNWIDPGANGMTSAMRIGLARGRVYERDLS